MNNRSSRMVAMASSVIAPLAVIAVFLFGLPAPAQASNIMVSPCTAAKLGAALASASDGDVITFNCSPGPHTITLTQTETLQHNFTIDGGGVITLSGGSSVRIITVAAGHAVNLDGLTFTDGRANQGGALRIMGSAVVSNSTFISNAAIGSNSSGGAVYVANTGQMIVSGSRFVSNQDAAIGGPGGAIYSTGVLTAVDTLFTDNTAPIGGAILVDGGRAWVGGSTFVKNSAVDGGAITTRGSLDLFNDEFDHNDTSNVFLINPMLPPGGGALNLGPTGEAAVERTIFFSNTASNISDGFGGAISSEGTVGMVDSLFNENTAQSDGGAIFSSGSLGIGYSNFTANAALGSGGAISNTGTLDLRNSLLAGNTAANSAGALGNLGQATVGMSVFGENTADAGGAVRNHASGVLFIGASTFLFNAAVTNGGGALLNNGVMTATNTTLGSNYSGSNGGAVFSGGAGAVTLLLNSTVVSNTSVASAAALRRTGGTLTLINTIVSGSNPANCSGTITDGGHNLQFGDNSCGAGITVTNPLLGPVADNGGPHIGLTSFPLETAALLPGSPAIDAGDQTSCPARDERGFQRLAPCDIGAFERVYPLLLPLLFK